MIKFCMSGQQFKNKKINMPKDAEILTGQAVKLSGLIWQIRANICRFLKIQCNAIKNCDKNGNAATPTTTF